MIRFYPRPKPDGFEAVENRGTAWLAAHATGRPPDYWSAFRTRVAEAFDDLCGYGAMYDPSGTVDHFISVASDRTKAYDWTNYRYCAAWINSGKQSLESTQLLDPFTVENEWFEVLLPSMQLVLTERVPSELRERAQFVLKRLHLDHDERIVRQRREWYRMYIEGHINLVGLSKKAPLIAAAIKRQEMS